MLVTLGDPAGAEVFSGGLKNGSSFQELSARGAAGGGGAGAAAGVELRGVLLKNWVKLPSEDAAGGGAGAAGAGGAAGLGALLKSCVRPPSADTESDTPCEEKPLAREGPDEVTGRGVSSDGREGGMFPGVTPGTKIRVNSPCVASDGGGGPFTTCVDTCGNGSLAGVAAAGRGPMELNICVNSPGPDPEPETGAGETAGTRGGAVFTGCGANGSAGVASFFVS